VRVGYVALGGEFVPLRLAPRHIAQTTARRSAPANNRPTCAATALPAPLYRKRCVSLSQVTDTGLKHALFLTQVHDRLLRAGLAQLSNPHPATHRQPQRSERNRLPHRTILPASIELDTKVRLRLRHDSDELPSGLTSGVRPVAVQGAQHPSTECRAPQS
jgi:hypothetical protein